MTAQAQRSRPLQGALVLAAGVLLVAGFLALRDTNDGDLYGSTGSSSLEMSDGTALQGMVSRGNYATFVLTGICLSQRGKATITKVTPITSIDGAELTDFVVFPTSQLPGHAAGDIDRLRNLPQFVGSKSVSEVCPQADAPEMQLAVEIHTPRGRDAFVDGIRVTYSLNGVVQARKLGYGIGLCHESEAHCLLQ